MAVLTNFLKLLKPEKNDYVDVDKHISENYDKIDNKIQELSTSNSGKLDKDGYSGTAQNLKNDIDGKVSKSGDTIEGILSFKNQNNGITFASSIPSLIPQPLNYHNYISGGSDDIGFEKMNNISINSWNGISFCTTFDSGIVPKNTPAVYIHTRNGELAVKEKLITKNLDANGILNLTDNRLQTLSKEVIGAINSGLAIKELRNYTPEQFNNITQAGVYRINGSRIFNGVYPWGILIVYNLNNSFVQLYYPNYGDRCLTYYRSKWISQNWTNWGILTGSSFKVAELKNVGDFYDFSNLDVFSFTCNYYHGYEPEKGSLAVSGTLIIDNYTIEDITSLQTFAFKYGEQSNEINVEIKNKRITLKNKGHNLDGALIIYGAGVWS